MDETKQSILADMASQPLPLSLAHPFPRLSLSPDRLPPSSTAANQPTSTALHPRVPCAAAACRSLRIFLWKIVVGTEERRAPRHIAACLPQRSTLGERLKVLLAPGMCGGSASTGVLLRFAAHPCVGVGVHRTCRCFPRG